MTLALICVCVCVSSVCMFLSLYIAELRIQTPPHLTQSPSADLFCYFLRCYRATSWGERRAEKTREWVCVSMASEWWGSISPHPLFLFLLKNVRMWSVEWNTLCVSTSVSVLHKRLSVVSGQLWEVNNKEPCFSNLLPSLYSFYSLLDWESCKRVWERERERKACVLVSIRTDNLTHQHPDV